MDLYGINWLSVLLRIVLAAILGGALGLGRERKNRAAGFRTHMLVAVGAALVMMTNQYVFQEFGASDPVRMGAQVISGIGFLGAGSIIITGKNQVRGITTAAGLWAAACGGLAIGIGFYLGAIVGGVAIFLIMTVMKKLDNSIRKKSTTVDLYVELRSQRPLREFISYSKANQLMIEDLEVHQTSQADDGLTTLILTATSRQNLKASEIVDLIEKAPNILYVEEILS